MTIKDSLVLLKIGVIVPKATEEHSTKQCVSSCIALIELWGLELTWNSNTSP